MSSEAGKINLFILFLEWVVQYKQAILDAKYLSPRTFLSETFKTKIV
jgi:hypothetical protein